MSEGLSSRSHWAGEIRSAWRVSSHLGLASGVLSLVMLIKQGFGLGLVAPLLLVLEYYHLIVEFLLGWTEVPLNEALSRLSRLIQVRLHLYPHWKHIFVLMWLYFASDSKANWGLGRKGFATFSIIWGGVVALTFSVGAGTVSADDPSAYFRGLTFPVAGLVTFELVRSAVSATLGISPPSFDTEGRSWWAIFWHCVTTYAAPIALLGCLAHLLAWQVDAMVPSLGSHNRDLLAPLIFVVALAFYWVGRGAWLGLFDRDQGESWTRRFQRSGSTHLGFLLLAVILGSILFLAFNVGLKLAGL